MSKTLVVSLRPAGREDWSVILRNDDNGLLTGGLSVRSFDELQSLAERHSATIEIRRVVRQQMMDAGVAPRHWPRDR